MRQIINYWFKLLKCLFSDENIRRVQADNAQQFWSVLRALLLAVCHRGPRAIDCSSIFWAYADPDWPRCTAHLSFNLPPPESLYLWLSPHCNFNSAQMIWAWRRSSFGFWRQWLTALIPCLYVATQEMGHHHLRVDITETGWRKRRDGAASMAGRLWRMKQEGKQPGIW